MKKLFDRKKLKIKPLSKRENLLDTSVIMPLEIYKSGKNKNITKLAAKIIESKKTKASSIMFMGAHVIRSGVQRYIIDMLEKGYINMLSFNGACVIHDFEFALIGATTESVAKYIKTGKFGLWKETGVINDIVNDAYKKGYGYGYAVGKYIYENRLPYRDISLLANCYRLGIDVTVHISIGCDIIQEHPNFNAAAAGEVSYRDFLLFTEAVTNLKNGVFMNFGSAIMGPEVFLKAFSMATNISIQKKKSIDNFVVSVFDIKELSGNYHKVPSKDNPHYYFRPLKNLLVRPLGQNCKSYYIRGYHKDTVRSLWTEIENFIEN